MEYCLTGLHHGSSPSHHGLGGLGLTVPRRTVLGGAAAFALPALPILPVLLTGCAKEKAEERKPLPDVAVLTGAIASEERLIALYESARRANAPLAARLDPFLARHREHLSVLRRYLVPGSGGRSPSPTAAAAPPAMPGDPDRALSLLRKAESQAAAARMYDVERVAPGVAQLLACIGACEAGHAAALPRSAR